MGFIGTDDFAHLVAYLDRDDDDKERAVRRLDTIVAYLIRLDPDEREYILSHRSWPQIEDAARGIA